MSSEKNKLGLHPPGSLTHKNLEAENSKGIPYPVGNLQFRREAVSLPC